MTNGSYEFGPFRLEATERMLLRDGQSVSLKPKVFDLLLKAGDERRACSAERGIDGANLAGQYRRGA